MKRGRIALTIPNPSGMLHVGHARSIFLADMICKERNIPFHIRIDSNNADADAIIELHKLLEHFEIEPDDINWINRKLPPDSIIKEIIGEQCYELIKNPLINSYAVSIWDDLVIHYPSLIIRGAEWVEPERWFDIVNAPSSKSYVEIEKLLFKISNRQHNEVNIPLITINNMKLSKTDLRVPWNCLEVIPIEELKKFLLSTVEINNGIINYDKHYNWSWNDYANIIRHS